MVLGRGGWSAEGASAAGVVGEAMVGMGKSDGPTWLLYAEGGLEFVFHPLCQSANE
jgi:hypothetical protein